jgi:PKD repeat protein
MWGIKMSDQKGTRLIPLALALALHVGVISAGPPEFAPGAQQANQRAFPEVNLPASANGEEAIARLGDTLPAVAAWYGMTPAEFVHLLRTDNTAWIDVKGRVFYIEPLPEPAGESQQSDPVQAAPFPLSETFNLNSRPGSSRVIYLDFNGHTTSGTAWNNSYGAIISPAYSIDGNSAFSTTELELIQDMWRQVAEDFAPFDVNITTQDPGQEAITRSSSNDEYYGTRVVVTTDNFANCGCGGFAYLTAFNDVGDFYKPAFVFNSSLKGAGEAITHEVGHNLSLSHDGTSSVGYYQGHGSGATGWAPIMGVGYYQALVQWSKGEYSDANQLQDDIALIPAYGAPLMADDHGDSNSTASALGASANGTTATLNGSGMIRARGDVDVFRFLAGAGNYSITVNPAPYSPNLDIEAKLFNSSGGLVATSNPTNDLFAVLSGSLAAGEYFLRIDGVGKGDPLLTGYSDYGSLGRYTVTGTVVDPGGLVAPVAVAAAPGYAPGFAPLYVAFDGSGSTDSDGTVTAWDWNFGDGGTASGALVSHQYNAPGTYNVSLTVTDNNTLSDSDSLVITVNNRAPVAAAGADVISGTAPLTVNFNSAGSNDPDSSGSIASYAWDFGDGGNSSAANPSHTYTTAGSFDAILTVTDNLGATDDAAAVTVDVAPPPFVDQYATSQNLGSGTVSGDYAATHVADGLEQSILERESGGRKTGRYSYLEHTWVFAVQPGDGVTLSLTARQDNSSDGDTMLFAYSVNGGTFQPMSIPAAGLAYQSVALPLIGAEVGGEVRVRVADSDQTAGHNELNTVYVDQIVIRTNNQSGEVLPPDAATGLGATAVSSSQIDLLWTDNSGNETGFRVERLNGGSWDSWATVGANKVNHSDTGLEASTGYSYRVVAFNSGGDAVGPSNTASATTLAAAAISLDSASGYKVKGVQWASLGWTASGNVDLYRDTTKITPPSGSKTYEDNIGAKGAGNYTYKVCPFGSTTGCSNERIVVF